MTKPASLICVILAAGKGTRMKSALPKPLHCVAGLPMVSHVLSAVQSVNASKTVVVIGPDMPGMADTVSPAKTYVQSVQNGTGGAALAAADTFENHDGDVLILFGDTPLITPATIEKLLAAKNADAKVGVAYSAMQLENPKSYGRMVVGADGYLQKIVEYKDASESERTITLCNGAAVVASGKYLAKWLRATKNDNAQGEYYLTDLPALARADNLEAIAVTVDADDMEGVNSRADLAYVEGIAQHRLRRKHMDNGATLLAPETVYFSHDTHIGRDVLIEPGCFFGAGVTIGDNVTIHAYSHIEGATVDAGASIGPFARIRPGSHLGANSKVGNFVELKKTDLGAGAKVNHLSYVGDSVVGEKANIGAGVITCNYDGFAKYKTVVGKYAFVGSNSALVAPVKIGDGAFVGAGSTITADVPPDSLSLTRTPQITKSGWAAEFRKNKN